MLNRRSFLAATFAATATASRAHALAASRPAASAFQTRGVVLVPDDFSLTDWPERAARAGLTTIGVHHPTSPRAMVDWLSTDPGQRFLESSRKLGLEIEYELHAMAELLPRQLFDKSPDFFRMDESGRRNPDANLCPTSEPALAIVAEKALALAQSLRPSTGRYYYWGDDGLPWCTCPKCRELAPSEQSLLVENHLLRALRSINPAATLAHLAYTNTLAPPKAVKPEPGVFLEYAPIRRRYDQPFEQQTDLPAADSLGGLDANLEVFPTDTTQVLEYWIDVSMISGWKRPAIPLPWRRDVLEADAAMYAKRGIRHVTSFAVYVDAEYQRLHGEPSFIAEYGEVLNQTSRAQ